MLVAVAKSVGAGDRNVRKSDSLKDYMFAARRRPRAFPICIWEGGLNKRQPRRVMARKRTEQGAKRILEAMPSHRTIATHLCCADSSPAEGCCTGDPCRCLSAEAGSVGVLALLWCSA